MSNLIVSTSRVRTRLPRAPKLSRRRYLVEIVTLGGDRRLQIFEAFFVDNPLGRSVDADDVDPMLRVPARQRLEREHRLGPTHAADRFAGERGRLSAGVAPVVARSDVRIQLVIRRADERP